MFQNRDLLNLTFILTFLFLLLIENVMYLLVIVEYKVQSEQYIKIFDKVDKLYNINKSNMMKFDDTWKYILARVERVQPFITNEVNVITLTCVKDKRLQYIEYVSDVFV